MAAASVYDVLPTIGADVFADRGHQRAQDVSAAYDETELLAGVEDKADRQQVDFDVDDLAGRELLDPVEAVSGHVIGRQRLVEVARGNAQPPSDPL